MGNRISRRDFVKSASFAAAPLFVSASALGLEGRTAPSGQITMGFVGIGVMNWGHLKSFTRMKDDVKVLAVCDVDKNRREHAKKHVDDAYGNKDCSEYVDFRELCARKDIDAVCCATPDHWHVLVSIEAMKNGKDVYCEKPLSHTLAESEVIVQAVRKCKKILQTGSQQRSEYDGRFRLACELVRSGRIGKLLTIHIGVAGPPRPCDLPEEKMEPGLDWDMWLGAAPGRPYNSVLSPRGVHGHFPAWRAYQEYGTGYLGDIGAHHFDIAQWGMDMDGDGPAEIIPPQDPKEGRGVRFVYENGVQMIHGGPGGIQFTGTGGMIYVDRGQIFSNPDKIVKEPLGEKDVHLENSGGNHRRNWIDCVKSRKDPICRVEVGAGSAAVCHLANLAYIHGKTLRWDPKKWEFKDRSDNKLLDKKRRSPWKLPKI